MNKKQKKTASFRKIFSLSGAIWQTRVAFLVYDGQTDKVSIKTSKQSKSALTIFR